MGRIIGIDLGNEVSQIAVIENGKPTIIIDNFGNRIIPSVVGVTEDNETIIAGHIAEIMICSSPDKCVVEFKRLIGTDKNIKLGNKEYLPHEITAEFLKELKKYAESYLGEEVTEAVITVPANFNNSQRKLTKKAGELAGLKVDRIINEPTAAAMAYGINNLDKDEKVLVYDLGGGTFDVTILEMYDGILEVLASRGNNKLGGKDFDERIVRYIEEEFRKQHRVGLYDNVDAKMGLSIKSRVREAAISAKKELSSQMSTTINIPFLTIINNKPINISIKLTREVFEELTYDLVKSTENTIEDVLKDAKCDIDDINAVILVGESSRISVIQKSIRSKFLGKIKSGINPEEVVVLGAALQAEIIKDKIRDNSLKFIDSEYCNNKHESSKKINEKGYFMGKFIGIDLGTTTSEIAFIENGKPTIIIDNFGNRIIPSVVGFDEDNETIQAGHTAENGRMSEPDRYVVEFKRLIGTDKKTKLGKKEYLPHEISAELLKELKKYAEKYLGEEVTEAVITVPANFNNSQRKLTKKAGELAGLKVDRIINEPTAAAMAYGINNLDKDEKVLVYDLGGGTFDVTILEMYDGILEVLASRGNNKLGGKDFDERIVRYIEEEFRKQHRVGLYDNVDAKMGLSIKSRVREAAISAKKELSSQMSTTINIPFLTIINNKPINISIKLTREVFEELTYDLVKSTEDTIEDALKGAKCNIDDINVVILVGGSSRITAVQKLVHDKFPGKIKSGINPDEAVALGAAVQAGIKSDEISSEDSLIVIDKCSYNLGISVAVEMNDRLVPDVFDCLIKRDSSIPCSRKKIYSTTYDNQTEVNIEVYEGESLMAVENEKIDDFILPNIPKGAKGEEKIEVEFNYNKNGILQVKAIILSTGESITKIIDNFKLKKAREKTSDLIDDYINKRANLSDWINHELAGNVKNTIELAEKKMKKLDDYKINKLQVLIDKLKQAIIDGDIDLVEKYDEELTDILLDI